VFFCFRLARAGWTNAQLISPSRRLLGVCLSHNYAIFSAEKTARTTRGASTLHPAVRAYRPPVLLGVLALSKIAVVAALARPSRSSCSRLSRWSNWNRWEKSPPRPKSGALRMAFFAARTYGPIWCKQRPPPCRSSKAQTRARSPVRRSKPAPTPGSLRCPTLLPSWRDGCVRPSQWPDLALDFSRTAEIARRAGAARRDRAARTQRQLAAATGAPFLWSGEKFENITVAPAQQASARTRPDQTHLRKHRRPGAPPGPFACRDDRRRTSDLPDDGNHAAGSQPDRGFRSATPTGSAISSCRCSPKAPRCSASPRRFLSDRPRRRTLEADSLSARARAPSRAHAVRCPAVSLQCLRTVFPPAPHFLQKSRARSSKKFSRRVHGF